ncbi:putative GMC oxidoreductase [Xylaria bambusicola]|uniref:putative GMC oxidoreductase n=1 Tax=Xylaria bambusicola TaxID=326684 RepID=UPI0020079516|nr:putative GMC oxidoreductase [Xylaria bambusicola]KAI0528004.1 putative GMC oxidoreductase [Xylaria bambusicola]
MTSNVYDIIIIGGGTAGCVLASRLSEKQELQVLVIEAGDDLTDDPRANHPLMGPRLLTSDANWGFTTTPQKLGGREMIAPAGRLLGGSSAVNGFAFLPNSKASIDAWAELGNPGWEWASFSKSMSRFHLSESTQEEGQSPLQITIPKEETQWPRVWRETLSNLGFPVCSDPFSGKLLGSVIGPETIGSDKKRSFAANAYLDHGTRSRSNLTVWTGTFVEKILTKISETVTATGVQYSNAKTGVTGTVHARKEVILSAGAINTPRLLEASGFGNKKLLNGLGIDVMVDNPHIGENLQNHPMFTVTYEAVDQEGFNTIDDLLRRDPVAIAEAQKAYDNEKAGPASQSNLNVLAQLPIPDTAELRHAIDTCIPSRPGGTVNSLAMAHESFIRSHLTSPSEASGCYMTAPGYICFGGDKSVLPPPPGSEKYFTISAHLGHPLSRGSVHITSALPPKSSKGVSIDPNLFGHPLDLEVLARHVQLAERIAMTKPLSDHLKLDGKRGLGMPEFGEFLDLQKAKDYLLSTAVGAHHWLGSCAMMPREMGGVVGPSLRVYGCPNLRVCDASIMPIAPRSNPQGVIYAIAEHAAQIIMTDM